MARAILLAATVAAALAVAFGATLRGVDVSSARDAVSQMKDEVADVESALDGAIATESTMASTSKSSKAAMDAGAKSDIARLNAEITTIRMQMSKSMGEAKEKQAEMEKKRAEHKKEMGDMEANRERILSDLSGSEQQLAATQKHLDKVKVEEDQLSVQTAELVKLLSSTEGAKKCASASKSPEEAAAAAKEAKELAEQLAAEVASKKDNVASGRTEIEKMGEAIKRKSASLEKKRGDISAYEEKMKGMVEKQRTLNDEVKAEIAALEGQIEDENARMSSEMAAMEEKVTKEHMDFLSSGTESEEDDDLFKSLVQVRAVVARARSAHARVAAQLEDPPVATVVDKSAGDESSDPEVDADATEELAKKMMDRHRTTSDAASSVQSKGEDCQKKFESSMDGRIASLQKKMETVATTIGELCAQSRVHRESILSHSMKNARMVAARRMLGEALLREMQGMRAINAKLEGELKELIDSSRMEKEAMLKQLASLQRQSEEMSRGLTALEQQVSEVELTVERLRAALGPLKECKEVALMLEELAKSKAELVAELQLLGEDRRQHEEKYHQLKGEMDDAVKMAKESAATSLQEFHELELENAKGKVRVDALNVELRGLKSKSVGRTSAEKKSEKIDEDLDELKSKSTRKMTGKGAPTEAAASPVDEDGEDDDDEEEATVADETVDDADRAAGTLKRETVKTKGSLDTSRASTPVSSKSSSSGKSSRGKYDHVQSRVYNHMPDKGASVRRNTKSG